MRSKPRAALLALHSPFAAIPRVVAAMVLLACLAGPAWAQYGTAPRFFCSKSYVFGKAVPNGQVLAAQGGLVHVETLHFIEHLFIPGFCPNPFPATVTMTATLDCASDPDLGPFVFGPFPITQGGFTQIAIDIPVPAGPERFCSLIVDSTITFADGMVLRQSGDQAISLVPQAPGQPGVPVAGIEILGNSIECAHPGDPRDFVFRLTNNHPTDSLSGTFVAVVLSTGGLPELVSGTDGPDRGIHSVSDPDRAAPFPTSMHDCPPPPQDPAGTYFLQFSESVNDLAPGQSIDIVIRSRPYGASYTGALCETEAAFEGAFSGGGDVSLTAGYVLATDPDKPTSIPCPLDAGRTLIASPGSGPLGPTIVMSGDPTPDGSLPRNLRLQLDLDAMDLLIDGQPIVGGTAQFSGVTFDDGDLIRLVSEWSFIVPRAPPDSQITMITEFEVTPTNNPNDDTVLDSLTPGLLDGVPNGFEDQFPVLGVQAGLSLQGDPDTRFVFDISQQLFGVGVEETTFAQVEMVNLDTQIELVAPGRYRVSSTWTAPNPGTRNLIGFDVQNDFRGIALTPLEINPIPGTDFMQVDYDFQGAPAPDSNHGYVSVDFDAVAASTGIASGFLNITTDQGWVVRNLPILDQNQSPFVREIGTMFNLLSPGQSQDVADLLIGLEVTPDIQEDFNKAPDSRVPVGTVTINAQGENELVPPGGAPDVQLLTGQMFFDASQGASHTIQNNHPIIEQAKNQCLPGAVANSLQWLEDFYGVDQVDIPHGFIPGDHGNPPGSLVGQLDQFMQRPVDGATNPLKGLEGKLKYLYEFGLRESLFVKHWGTADGDVSVPGHTSHDRKPEFEFLSDFIKHEIATGEDVELGMAYPKGGGHRVEVIGFGQIGGICYILFVHDGAQGEAGGVTARDGGVVFTPLVPVEGTNGVLLGFSNARITNAYSQSPKCKADLTSTADPNDPDFGEPDGSVDSVDYFTFLDLFVSGDPRADMTGSGDPSNPDYGIPDGVIDGDDFFYFLDQFSSGCP